MFQVDCDISVRRKVMESFPIEGMNKYQSGSKIREGYKRRMVESGYLEMKDDILNRGTAWINAARRGMVNSEGIWSSLVWQWLQLHWAESRWQRALDIKIRRLHFIQLAVRSQGIFWAGENYVQSCNLWNYSQNSIGWIAFREAWG